MKVFLSWSGDRSKAVAETFRDWLPEVIQSIEPWLSANDIEKGRRWSHEIATQLSQSKVGIFCMTRENLNARWLLFEAGAISKTEDARACTFLLDIRSADIEPPLSEFQHTTCTMEDVRQLLGTINNAIERDGQNGERPLPEQRLSNVFNKAWPELESKLKAIAQSTTNFDSAPVRAERDILEEVLDVVRNLQQRTNSQSALQPAFRNYWIKCKGTELAFQSLMRHLRIFDREAVLNVVYTNSEGDWTLHVMTRIWKESELPSIAEAVGFKEVTIGEE
ncbi:MAG: toll/interleukin-1 receptor domain-containing protein [Abitibacteriaceae bacterium]|nr:toll/interleukin-1 receptor domain-containing protein [Abditibacteriaceae bacterium]MBV9864841.1 toll/interleukin-1 receptor domain-containing protein [Abditibacteriaceae bacterium]